MNKKIFLSVMAITLIIILLIVLVPIKNKVENKIIKAEREVCEEKIEWVTVESFYVKGNFTMNYEYLGNWDGADGGAAGGGGGLRYDARGQPFTWKDNIDYSSYCKNGTINIGGMGQYPSRNNPEGDVVINCAKVIIKEECHLEEYLFKKGAKENET